MVVAGEPPSSLTGRGCPDCGDAGSRDLGAARPLGVRWALVALIALGEVGIQVDTQLCRLHRHDQVFLLSALCGYGIRIGLGGQVVFTDAQLA
jgi:hypothetical protein